MLGSSAATMRAREQAAHVLQHDSMPTVVTHACANVTTVSGMTSDMWVLPVETSLTKASSIGACTHTPARAVSCPLHSRSLMHIVQLLPATMLAVLDIEISTACSTTGSA